MKHNILIAITAIILGVALIGCKTSSTSVNDELKNETLLSINDRSVTVEEFVYTYEKNNKNNAELYSEDDLNDYMSLFKTYQLKVAEAEMRGMDSLPAFRKEYRKYKKQLAKPYLTEPEFNDHLAKEVYERLKWDISTSHILIRMEQNPAPEDTLIAYKKIQSIYQKLLTGSDFEALAVSDSEDPSAQMENAPRGYQGNLGYFTALSLVYEYENAMFRTEVGQLSKPFRTAFGYHILRVNDKKESLGEIEVAHIMVSAPNGIALSDSIAAKKRIETAYEELKKGAKFSDVCVSYSDDIQTKEKGGRLPSLTMGSRVGPDFEAAAFSLKNNGDFSGPIKTPFGWHIIKLLDKSEGKEYDEVKTELINKVKRKPRAQLNEEVLVTRLKAENNFQENTENKELALSNPDSLLLQGKWRYSMDDTRLLNTLITINGLEYSTERFYGFCIKLQTKQPKTTSPQVIINHLYKKWIAKELTSYEEAHLSKKYPAYRLLLKEYRDGILLFDLMNAEVWNKAIKDTSGLSSFYMENKDAYWWEERIDATIYTLRDTTLATFFEQKLSLGLSNDDLIQEMNKIKPLSLKIKTGKFDKKTAGILSLINWDKPNQNFSHDGKLHYVIIHGKVSPAQKTLQDARGLIISEYQDQLEKEWISELEKRHTISVDSKVFEKLLKK
jgi:peptidyl-prolyl cis-trans isomerase SurA